jgi:hypothetical protein
MIDSPSWSDNPIVNRALVTICTASLPVIGWIARMVFGIDVRLTKMETVVEERTPLITEMQRIQITDGNRLVSAEASLATLQRLQESADRQFAAINLKLEILPRIEESMANLARVCATIVPRGEWELSNKSVGERMQRIEHESSVLIAKAGN